MGTRTTFRSASLANQRLDKLCFFNKSAGVDASSSALSSQLGDWQRAQICNRVGGTLGGRDIRRRRCRRQSSFGGTGGTKRHVGRCSGHTLSLFRSACDPLSFVGIAELV